MVGRKKLEEMSLAELTELSNRLGSRMKYVSFLIADKKAGEGV